CGKMLFASERFIAWETGGRKVVFCDDVCKEAGVGAAPPEMLPKLLRSWMITDCYKTNNAIDPITLEVMNGALSSICKEMARTMERAAYSPVFYEGADMTTALFGADMSLIAEYEGIPAQM